MKGLIEINRNEGTNQGYCIICRRNFCKGDYIIVVQKGEINKVRYVKVCAEFYLQLLADKMGWKEIQELILKILERKI